MSIRSDHAIVIGGSIAGLAAAKAISPFFREVTIIERDRLPEAASHRRGVPQGVHLHGLLNGGRIIFDELYGSFTEELVAIGAPFFDNQRHAAMRFPEGWLRRSPGEMKVLCARRPTIEDVIRRLTLGTANINVIMGTAYGLKLGQDGKSVVGVKVKEGDGTRFVEADLTIDATGRPSRSPQWVEEMGFAPPVETIVKSYLGYATLYGIVPEDAWPLGLRGLGAPPFPGCLRGGFLVPQDDGTTGIMAAGQNRDFPPRDPAEFDAFLANATTPLLRDIYRAAEPVTDIEVTRTSHNRLRNWHKVSERPRRLLIVGDAAAAYNPVYGQGMTGAAKQAMMLRRAFRELESLEDAADILQPKIMASIGFAWSAAVEADLGFSGTVSENLERSEAAEEQAAYFRDVRRVATADDWVASKFMTAIHMQEPDIFRDPEFQERVARIAPTIADKSPSDLSYPPPQTEMLDLVEA